VTAPAIVSRAGWGADETVREQGDPGYAAAIKVAFVHHTDSGVNVTCADSAAIIRSIYLLHVKTRGWADIGYNFLVDKCGTVFEGRHGGVDQPVIGAHAKGFNTGSVGIAVIGSYVSQEPTAESLAAVAHVAAWKLGQYGVNPVGSTTLVEGVSDSYGFTLGQSYPFQNISGHRNGEATECPGDKLYARLPAVRSFATQVFAPTFTGFGAQISGGVRYVRDTMVITWKPVSPVRLTSRYELLLDGTVVATLPGSSTALRATVPAGRHTLQLLARHLNGSGAATSGVAVFGDRTPPTFPGPPATRLRGGTVSTSAVPVQVVWKAADDTILSSVQGTAPSPATFAPTVTSWLTSAAPGTRTYGLKAVDLAQNAQAVAWSATTALVAESSATRAGTWTARSGRGYLGGSALGASTAGASLTWKFTGRGAAWVATRSATSGQARVYLDGKLVSTLDLYAAAMTNRQAVWAWNGTSAAHTVQVVVVGTRTRPTVVTDGLVVLR
jgi:hypothetical protein